MEQQVNETVGVFARAGWADGHVEPWDNTDIDRTSSTGAWEISRALLHYLSPGNPSPATPAMRRKPVILRLAGLSPQLVSLLNLSDKLLLAEGRIELGAKRAQGAGGSCRHRWHLPTAGESDGRAWLECSPRPRPDARRI
jgi:hypothetical protein